MTTKAKNKPLPLKKWVAQFPSQAEAAIELRTTAVTLNRWLNGHMKPTNKNTLARMDEVGIDTRTYR